MSFRKSSQRKFSRSKSPSNYIKPQQPAQFGFPVHLFDAQQANNAQQLLKFFQQYRPRNQFIQMDELFASETLKLKKYKQSVFYGEMVNFKKHGKGIMIYNNGRFYQGQWINDHKHGQGYEQFSSKCVYQGNYVNGKPEGFGKYHWANGQSYEGEWANGLKHGSGMWRGANGDSYIGEWKNGKVDGYGVHVWANGDNYEGEFSECLKHGQGIQKFANGDIYKGSYANGKPNGYGEYFWANHSYFKGTFKNGLRDGRGFWKKHPGLSDKYEGDYINDKKHGYGTFNWANGNRYKGNYVSDLRHGYGEMYWSDGSTYKGEWKKGIQHGKGELYIPDQGYKTGIFQNNVLIIVQKQAQKSPDREFDPENSFSNFNSRIKGNSLTRNDFRIHQKHEKKSVSVASNHTKSFVKQSQLPKSLKHRDSFIKQDLRKYQTLVPKVNSKVREAKYLTLDRKVLKPKEKKQIIKQRLLHSSFYLHKIQHQRATSKQDRRIIKNVQIVKRDMLHEMGLSEGYTKQMNKSSKTR